MIGVIKQEMKAKEIASIIFKEFAIHQSTSIRGFENIGNSIFEKGVLVSNHLKELDRKEYFVESSDGRDRRKFPKLNKNAKIIGKYLNQKAFKYENTIRDGQPTTNIWRIQ